MQVFKTEVQPDHLERLLRIRPPVALAELIWNALDADAMHVRVAFGRDFTGSITSITVTDDGTGISELDASNGFRKLGGSWKALRGSTRRDKRVLHGKNGQGRFTAFALGSDVAWESWSKGAVEFERLTLDSARDRIGEFRMSDIERAAEAQPGTVVKIVGLLESANVLDHDAAHDELLETFALYLRQYPQIEIEVDGAKLDPQSLQTYEFDYKLPAIDVDGRKITDAELTILEWRSSTTRSLYMCTAEGIARHSLPLPTLRAPGFEFTAYLRSAYVQELYDSNDLFTGHLHPGVKELYDAAFAQIRDHFRRRAAERTAELLGQWKAEGAYPYQGEPSNPVEEAERKAFDVIAVNVNEYLPDFSAGDTKTRQFSLQLVRQAIESNPSSMQRILSDVLGLPKVRQDELADLLKETTLSAVIAASKVVADRLKVLRAIEALLFDRQSKKELKERSQLHKILVDHTWLFGEAYNLCASDESLDAVLDKHIKLLGRKERSAERVRGITSDQQIVDLMLSQRLATRDDEREHLVVELKRPLQKIDEKVFGQITKYAMAVAKDERFRDTKTSWTFIAISNEMDEFVRMQARQPGRPRGVIGEIPEAGVRILARTWAEILEECRGRHEFFRRQLDYNVNRESALDHLRRTHAKYFPPVFAAQQTGDLDDDDEAPDSLLEVS